MQQLVCIHSSHRVVLLLLHSGDADPSAPNGGGDGSADRSADRIADRSGDGEDDDVDDEVGRGLRALRSLAEAMAGLAAVTHSAVSDSAYTEFTVRIDNALPQAFKCQF